MFRLPDVAVLVSPHFIFEVTVKIPCIKVEACRKKIFDQTQYLSPLPTFICLILVGTALLKLTTRFAHSKVVNLPLLTIFPLKPFGYISSSHYSINPKLLYLF